MTAGVPARLNDLKVRCVALSRAAKGCSVDREMRRG